MGNIANSLTTEKAQNFGSNAQMNTIPKTREEVSE